MASAEGDPLTLPARWGSLRAHSVSIAHFRERRTPAHFEEPLIVGGWLAAAPYSADELAEVAAGRRRILDAIARGSWRLKRARSTGWEGAVAALKALARAM